MKKRESYGTVMVDILSHRIVDMIGSRDYEHVKEWLESYPNLNVVSRDGSITYRSAISDAHPSAVQVSDRFHLLKNLISYSQEYLKKHLRQSIPIVGSVEMEKVPLIPATKSDENRRLALKEKYERIQELIKENYPKTRICKMLNMDIRAYDKLISSTPEELALRFQTKQSVLHEERVANKLKYVEEVRELKRMGLSKREISRRTGFSFRTIRRYLSEDYDPVHASYGKKKDSILEPYVTEIESMAAMGTMGTAIEIHIRNMGYTGSSSTLRHYLSNLKKGREHGLAPSSPKERLSRSDVFKLLYHPAEKVKAVS